MFGTLKVFKPVLFFVSDWLIAKKIKFSAKYSAFLSNSWSACPFNEVKIFDEVGIVRQKFLPIDFFEICVGIVDFGIKLPVFD